jgi:putative oxidoreductase
LRETFTFFLATTATTFIVFACIVWNASVRTAQIMARIFYALTIVLSVAALVYILLSASGLLSPGPRGSALLRFLIFRGWLVIGTGIGSTLLIMINGATNRSSRFRSEAIRAFIISPRLLDAICISISISFICTEIGKLTHDAEMREFFVQSGYPVWFLYFTMIAETVGSFALLLRRTVVPAAFGLALIMMGAIFTHLRNHDPFSDSIEALHLLMLLLCVLVIHILQTRIRPPSSGYAQHS